jgi:hypothetical protein
LHLKFLQSIPSDGAHGCEFFEFDRKLYLFIANFGDRQGKRYDAISTVWVFVTSQECQADSDVRKSFNTIRFLYFIYNYLVFLRQLNPRNHDDCNTGIFQHAGDIHTFGATDGEFFSFRGKGYLAISEEGDLGKGRKSNFNSRVYKLDHAEG